MIGHRRRVGERSPDPQPSSRSYYGQPIIKAPVWRHDIPAYFFTGGLAAGSALLAAGADLSRAPSLRRAARLTSVGALAASTYFLINDLGRPDRFHHMLRVVKPTSPMSMGTWLLAAFGPAAGLAAAGELADLLPNHGRYGRLRRAGAGLGRAGGLAAAGLAPALGTYTAVLIANTAVPSWHEAYRQLPFVFAGSALTSAAGAGLLLAPVEQVGAARRLAVAGAAIELGGSRSVETRLGLLGEPYREGRAGQLLRSGRTITAVAVLGAVLGRRSRVVAALSGAALLVAAGLTRFGIYAGGVASTKDPRYTVQPQRERMDHRATSAR